jgi:hypothetical protein
MVELQE